MTVVEQRYRAVLAVGAGRPVTEVAVRVGVSRQTVHAWLARYREGGLAGLADRSHRPASCPQRVDAAVETAVCAGSIRGGGRGGPGMSWGRGGVRERCRRG